MDHGKTAWPWTIAEAGKRFRRGSLDSEALSRHYLAGIVALEPQLNFLTRYNMNL